MKVGLDIGSTTVKAIVLDENNNIVYKNYQRHLSHINQKCKEIISDIRKTFPETNKAYIAISGSAGMGLAEKCGIPFIQEVHATKICTENLASQTDVVIELGGEDAKIIFMKGIPDAKMNGSCAGGTGSFIDQMATLLNVSLEELNELSEGHEKIYSVASRCGVFAKSDIQPLLNQGVRINDIAASIFKAVVNQTITGLAQGRKIEGNILYLGGPLTFFKELRKSFDETLGLNGVCPENSLYFVCLGSAFNAKEILYFDELIRKLDACGESDNFEYMKPLFKDRFEYEEFIERHKRADIVKGSLGGMDFNNEPVFLGIDAGSTTIKFAVINEAGELLDSDYKSNSGNPVPKVKEYLEKLYSRHSGIKFMAAAVTGYGEDLIKNAFCMDAGIVETAAHFIAARHIEPEVDFILDIGGQDIKCMKIHNGVIDNIYLNEACSSGCGSFLQTFANAMGYDIEEFAGLGLFADKPVDLGSRCTVFMNSSVKQSQKEGASKENISAGLSISVVKNAIYKVIRPSSKNELGKHIVASGGTFYNDAVLRAFEREIERDIKRPNIAGLMGAYGAALYARGLKNKDKGVSSVLSSAELKAFKHDIKITNCGLCPNNCTLTVNNFGADRKYISGNRCSRPVTKKEFSNKYNLYGQKLEMLNKYIIGTAGKRQEKIGIPMGLNMYELLPFWHKFFSELGFGVVTSGVSDRNIYLKGQGTIPSDTVCYPAKLMHGHIKTLIEQGVSHIFYPCMTFNVDDNNGDNCYNCPIVAYYPEVINNNMKDINDIIFIKDYIGIHLKNETAGKLYKILKNYFKDIHSRSVKRAVAAAYDEYYRYMDEVRGTGENLIEEARVENKPIIMLAGRPYHIDPEINHGIDRLIVETGAAVVSEDILATSGTKCHSELKAKNLASPPDPLKVLDQWTYHRRLYTAAKLAAQNPDIQFVQLVSFGCGCDAITTDECRRVLEKYGKIYTQIKIDEIENLGAAKIRIKSLFAALEEAGADQRPG